MSEKPTAAPFNVSEEMKVKMPLRLLVALLGIVAVSAIAWASVRSDVARHGEEIGELQRHEREQRDLLIQIKTNTEALMKRADL